MKVLSLFLLFISISSSLMAKDYNVKAKVIGVEVNLSNSTFNKFLIRNSNFEETIYVRRDATIANKLLLDAIDSQNELFFEIRSGEVSYEYEGVKMSDISTPELRQVSNLPLGALP